MNAWDKGDAKMKPKTKPQLQLKANGAFPALVRECLEVERDLRSLDDIRRRKLTANAYVREAMRIAGTSAERVAKLRSALESPTTFATTEVAGSLRRMVAGIRSPNWCAPPSELRRLNHFLTPVALSELIALGSSSFELFALASVIVAQQFPESFGENNTSIADYDRRMMELHLQRDEIRQRISEWPLSTEDVVTGPSDAHGRVIQTFAMSNGAVSVHPRDNSGERLAHWLLTQEQNP